MSIVLNRPALFAQTLPGASIFATVSPSPDGLLATAGLNQPHQTQQLPSIPNPLTCEIFRVEFPSTREGAKSPL